jgi:hypothetical protein
VNRERFVGRENTRLLTADGEKPGAAAVLALFDTRISDLSGP